MRIFHIHNGGVQELTALPAQMPAQGFVWIACGRPAFQARLAEIQARLQTLVGLQLVDLHVSDLLNAQLPSHYDYTSQYDLLVFRRLATASAHPEAEEASPNTPPRKPTGPLVLRLSRKGMHLWYRGLALVLPQTHWNLPEPLPEWLQEPMTPAAVRDLLDRPLPPDLDKPASGR